MQIEFGKISASFNTGKVKRLTVLVVGIMVLWIFMNHIAPWMDQRPSVRPLINFIEENNIDASALYYTEIEEFSEADIQMNHSMDFAPRGP